jgi:hypothetical protein
VLAHLGRCDGRFELIVVHCIVFAPPADVIEQRKAECGMPFWPHAFVTVHGDIEALVQT